METRMLPPSGRDFEAYRLVQFEQMSTREAAEQLGISQTLIRRIVARVGSFWAEVTHEGTSEANKEERRKRLNVAEQVAAERVSHLYGEALRGFRASKGMQTTVRQRGYEPAVTTVKETQGECRYLLAAAQLALAGAKLPMSGLESYVNWEEEELSEEAAAESREEDVEAKNPPVEVCSAMPPISEVTAGVATREEHAKPVAVAICDKATTAANLPKPDEAQCAQLTISLREMLKLHRSKRAAREEFLAPLAKPAG